MTLRNDALRRPRYAEEYSQMQMQLPRIYIILCRRFELSLAMPRVEDRRPAQIKSARNFYRGLKWLRLPRPH